MAGCSGASYALPLSDTMILGNPNRANTLRKKFIVACVDVLVITNASAPFCLRRQKNSGLPHHFSSVLFKPLPDGFELRNYDMSNVDNDTY